MGRDFPIRNGQIFKIKRTGIGQLFSHSILQIQNDTFKSFFGLKLMNTKELSVFDQDAGVDSSLENLKRDKNPNGGYRMRGE